MGRRFVPAAHSNNGKPVMREKETGAVADRPRHEDERPALGADLIIPGLALAFTTYYLVTTLNLVWEAKANGVVVGLLLYGLIAMQLVRIGRRVASGEATLGLGGLAVFDTAQKQRIALVVITALFILTLPWVGISIGLFLTMLAFMWVLGERSWRVLIGLSVLTSASVYLVFVMFLQTRLPTGPVEALINWLAGGGA